MRCLRFIVSVAVMLLFATSVLAAESGTYVVLPFKVNGPAGFAYLEKAIPSMLSSRLYWKDHAIPVADSKAATAGRLTSASELNKARTTAGADYAVWGEVSILGDDTNMNIFVLDKNGKEWRKNSRGKVNDLIGSLQGMADSINADVLGRPLSGASAKTASAMTMGNQMNPDFVHNEATQKQVYLNPQFRYQGNEGTRLRSQNLPFASLGMEIADFDGDKKNEIALLSKDHVYMYRWSNQGLQKIDEYKLPTALTPMMLRSIDLNRNGRMELIVVTCDQEDTSPRSFIFSFRNGKFTVLAERLSWYLNVQRLPPDFMPILVGQKGDSSRIFAKSGVQELIWKGNTVSSIRKIALPSGCNLMNFTWLPGKAGAETEKLIMLTGDENLKVFSPQGNPLYTSNEKFSGSAIGIAEQTTMPGMGKSNVLIPSKYFVPLRMIPADLEKDGTWEILVNRPLSLSAQFFENYRNFPESEIHTLFWDGVGLSLMWKTRRIKGSVVDFTLSDPNNDGVPDLVAAVNTHPGVLGLENRKTIVVVYPLDLSQTNPKTAPTLD